MKGTIFFVIMSLCAALLHGAFDDCAGLLAKGRQFEKAGDYAKAIELYRNAGDKAKGNMGMVEACVGQCRCLAAMKKYDEAEAILAVLDKNRGDLRDIDVFKLLLARAELCRGRGDEAKYISLIDEAVEHSGDIRMELIEMGRKFSEEGNHYVAEKLLYRAFKLPGALNSQDLVICCRRLAEAAFAGGRIKEAYSYLDEYEAKKEAGGYVRNEVERVRCALLLREKKYKECLLYSVEQRYN